MGCCKSQRMATDICMWLWELFWIIALLLYYWYKLYMYIYYNIHVSNRALCMWLLCEHVLWCIYVAGMCRVWLTIKACKVSQWSTQMSVVVHSSTSLYNLRVHTSSIPCVIIAILRQFNVQYKFYIIEMS